MCKITDSLFHVMETIVKAEVHRLIVVDNDVKVLGIVSLSDILSHLVLRPAGEKNTNLIMRVFNSNCTNMLKRQVSFGHY